MTEHCHISIYSLVPCVRKATPFSQSALKLWNSLLHCSLVAPPPMEFFPPLSYKHTGIWRDTSLTFKHHVEQLAQKLKIKMAFLYQNKQYHYSTVEISFIFTPLAPKTTCCSSSLCFVSGGINIIRMTVYYMNGRLALTCNKKRTSFHCFYSQRSPLQTFLSLSPLKFKTKSQAC